MEVKNVNLQKRAAYPGKERRMDSAEGAEAISEDGEREYWDEPDIWLPPVVVLGVRGATSDDPIARKENKRCHDENYMQDMEVFADKASDKVISWAVGGGANIGGQDADDQADIDDEHVERKHVTQLVDIPMDIAGQSQEPDNQIQNPWNQNHSRCKRTSRQYLPNQEERRFILLASYPHGEIYHREPEAEQKGEVVSCKCCLHDVHQEAV